MIRNRYSQQLSPCPRHVFIIDRRATHIKKIPMNNKTQNEISDAQPERHDTHIFLDLKETMIRRNKRDPADLLELGGPIHMTRTLPASIKRFTPKKVLKYVILIVLGVALHSIYREIFKAHQVTDHLDSNKEGDKQGIDKQVKIPDDHKAMTDLPKGRIMDSEMKDEQKLDEQKLKEMSQKVFEEEKIKHQEREKLRKIQEELAARQAEQREREIKENARKNNIANTNISDHNAKQADGLHQEKPSTSVEENVKDQKQTVTKGDNHAINQKIVIDHVDIDDKNSNLPKQIDIPESFINAAKSYGGVDIRPIIRPNDEKMPPLVIGATKKTYMKVRQLVMSIQKQMSKEKIYIYDVDLTENQYIMLAAMCGVEMRLLHLKSYPEFVRNSDIPYWRPIAMQAALKEHDHITWLNPEFHLTTDRLNKWYVHSSEHGVFVIGQLLGHTTYAVTHQNMYKYIPTDQARIQEAPYVNILALFLHNTDEIRENFMKILMACAMEPDCFAPQNVSRNCDYDVTGKKYAGCHLNDESAINIILNNWFNFQRLKFYSGNCCFKDYDKELNSLQPEMCGVYPNQNIEDEL